uniref:Uncharacterized protein n=1 Tax=Arundo donax TaxID=35708 RepID=A0A0A9DHR6_ARUDO
MLQQTPVSLHCTVLAGIAWNPY